MTTKNGNFVYSQAVTMMNPSTGWTAICTLPSTEVDLVSNQGELALLTRYLLLNKISVDRRINFSTEFKNMVQANNGIKVKPATSRKLHS